MKKVSLFIILFSIQMLYAEDFILNTTPPDAEIFVSSYKSKKPIKLGKSPLKMSSDEVFKLTEGTKTFTLEVKKEGFDPYRVVVAKTPNVEYKMEILLQVTSEIKTVKEHDVLISELFKAQRLIRANNLEDALALLNNLEQKHKDFSVISELKGIAYYMRKDFENALSMFRMAFSKNSKNTDAYKMKVYLEKRLGLDAEIN
jgi:tetratricopeptide (TPR) repeat protein